MQVEYFWCWGNYIRGFIAVAERNINTIIHDGPEQFRKSVPVTSISHVRPKHIPSCHLCSEFSI